MTYREHNMIRFKDGNPTGIWYSQHAYGEACSWEDETCFLKDGNRVCQLMNIMLISQNIR